MIIILYFYLFIYSSNIHHLRQAKLSFPSVQLIVGLFSDSQCAAYGIRCSVPHVERSEVIRHCRWVDEILQDAPVVIDEHFLINNNIDYVAVEEGVTLDPTISKPRLAGIDLVKSLGTVYFCCTIEGTLSYFFKAKPSQHGGLEGR